ncbi:MAG: hypothetical protein ABI837_19655, partial [Acidobacteriota bacterium]
EVAMKRGEGMPAAITRATRSLLTTRLMKLVSDGGADAQVRAQTADALRKLSARCSALTGLPNEEAAHRRATHDDIERFLSRPDEPRKIPVVPEVPPGPPIGD